MAVAASKNGDSSIYEPGLITILGGHGERAAQLDGAFVRSKGSVFKNTEGFFLQSGTRDNFPITQRILGGESAGRFYPAEEKTVRCRAARGGRRRRVFERALYLHSNRDQLGILPRNHKRVLSAPDYHFGMRSSQGYRL